MSELTEFKGLIIDTEAAATHTCPKHGKVVAFYPLTYQDHDQGVNVRSGPFCMQCMIDQQNLEYAGCKVEPIE